MKFYNHLLILLFILLYISPADLFCEEEKFPYMGVVTADKVRVLPRRGTNYREIITLNQNDLVTVVGRNGEWLNIEPPDEIACWISGDYVDNGVVTGSQVNVRQGAGINYPILGQVGKGDTVEVVDQRDSWYRIAPPTSIRLWVNANFVKYFSSVARMSIQLERLEASKSMFDSALGYAKSQLSQDGFENIDFDGMRDRFYQVIKEFPETIQSRKALFELKNIENEQAKRESAFVESQRQQRVKELFAEADRLSYREFQNNDIEDVNIGMVMDKYIDVIRESCHSEEAKWAIARITDIQQKVRKAKEEERVKRIEALQNAEQFRNEELLKDVDSIDYPAIYKSYKDIVDLYPNTPEAQKAAERIADLERRSPGIGSNYTVSVQPQAQTQDTSYYVYEGVLLKDADLDKYRKRYRIEERRGLFNRKDICVFVSDESDMAQYRNKKVRVVGSIQAYDEKNRPIITIIRIELIQ